MAYEPNLSRPPYWYYFPNAIDPNYFEPLKDIALSEAKQHQMTMYNQTFLSRRISAVYTDTNLNTIPYGEVPVYPWNEILLEIKKIVEEATSQKYQYMLMHLYRDHTDTLGYHRDREAWNSTIVSVSLGASRRFLLRADKNKADVTEIVLNSGDVIVMTSDCQRHFKHGVPPMTIADVNHHLTNLGCQPLRKKWSIINEEFAKHPELIPQRINLTFRQAE